MKWIKADTGHTTFIDGYKVDRVTCMSGRRHYYLHYIVKGYSLRWVMTDKYYSLKSIRTLIEAFKTRDDVMSETYLKANRTKVISDLEYTKELKRLEFEGKDRRPRASTYSR